MATRRKPFTPINTEVIDYNDLPPSVQSALEGKRGVTVAELPPNLRARANGKNVVAVRHGNKTTILAPTGDVGSAVAALNV